MTFFSRCKGPELQDCLGQTLALIRYGGLGDLGSWEYLGKGRYLLGRVKSLFILAFYIQATVTGLGDTRIQASGLPFLRLTCSSLGVEIEVNPFVAQGYM